MLLYNSTPQINPHLTQCNVNPRLCHTYHIHIPIECLWSNTAYHNKFLCQIKSIYQTQRVDEALCGSTPSARGKARVDATVSCHFTFKVISLSILKHSILKYTCICPQIRSLEGQNSRQCFPLEEIPSKVWKRGYFKNFRNPSSRTVQIMVKCFKSFVNFRLWHISRPNPITKITKSDSFII